MRKKNILIKCLSFIFSNEYRYDSESGEIVTSPDNDISYQMEKNI